MFRAKNFLDAQKLLGEQCSRAPYVFLSLGKLGPRWNGKINRLVNFQLSSSSYFAFRAFQSFRRPSFFTHPLIVEVGKSAKNYYPNNSWQLTRRLQWTLWRRARRPGHRRLGRRPWSRPRSTGVHSASLHQSSVCPSLFDKIMHVGCLTIFCKRSFFWGESCDKFKILLHEICHGHTDIFRIKFYIPEVKQKKRKLRREKKLRTTFI